MTTTPNAAVLAAITDITSKIGSVKKSGRNDFHHYDYATAADLLHKLQPMLAEAGLVIITTQKELRFLDQQQSLLAIDYEFSLHHKSGAVHPERPVVTGMASARNSKGTFDDKAANKCLTAATKYFLLNLFKIPTGDYDDADADGDAPAPKVNGNGGRVTEQQLATLRTAIKEVDADEAMFVRYLKVPDLASLPAARFPSALDALNAKRAKQ